MRVARNLAGGGDRAAARLEIAQMERRRAEVEAGLRLAVAERVAELEVVGRRLDLAREREAAHGSRLSLLAAGYRLGEGSTEGMMALWQTREEIRGRVAEAAADSARQWARLRALVPVVKGRSCMSILEQAKAELARSQREAVNARDRYRAAVATYQRQKDRVDRLLITEMDHEWQLAAMRRAREPQG